jgi:hypothetical protein
MAPVRIQACCYLHWVSIQSPNYINSQFHRSGILLFNSKDCSCPESEDFMSILLVGTQTFGLGRMDMDYHITELPGARQDPRIVAPGLVIPVQPGYLRF